MTTDLLLPPIPTRGQIDRLEAELKKFEDDGYGIPIQTWTVFADGLVARTILIPAGTTLTGSAHKAEHINICHGDIDVWTEAGMKRLTGHHVLPSLPGTKRAGHAHADTWWTTVHMNPGNERDIAKLEDALVFDADNLQSRRTLPAPADSPLVEA